MATTLDAFIQSQVSELEPRMVDLYKTQWMLATTGQPQYEEQLGRQMRELRGLLADPKRYRALNDLVNQSDTAMIDALVARQATLLNNQLRGSQISLDLIARMTDLEVQVQSAFTKFRAAVGGKAVTDNDLNQVLRESDDVALRQEAWEASKQIGAQVADTVRELARVRNEAARQVGFDNYYSMRLELDELNQGELYTLLDQLKAGSDPAWQAYKTQLDAQLAARFHIQPSELRPWHYGDRFFQEGQPSTVNLDPYFADKDLETLTRAYYNAIGLDIDDVLARSDLYEREGKEQHAFCTHIDRKGDVRVLCNNRPNARWADTMLHEFGHAVYDKYINATLPFLLREPAHILTTEAIAILGGDHVNESAWLVRYAGVPREDAQKMEQQLREAARTHALIFARWVFVMCHFERELYRDPEQDLNTLWWDLVERFQWVRRPDGRNAPDWAAKIHIGTAPVYYHNYLLGAMMAAQLREYIRTHVVDGSADAYVSDPRVGQYLVERVFKPGSTRDWRGWLRYATDTDLSADYYVQQLSGA
jgi:peptidyl-dipeptidase A